KKQTHLSVKDCRKDIQKVKPNEFFDYQQLLAQTSKNPLRDWHDIEDLF
ncbi:post-transcriptional regulator, partial [Enterococcus faecalis]